MGIAREILATRAAQEDSVLAVDAEGVVVVANAAAVSASGRTDDTRLRQNWCRIV